MSGDHIDLLDSWEAELRCELGDAEVAERADELARSHGDLERLEAEESVAKAGFKQRRQTLVGRQAELAREVRERKAERPVRVEKRADYNTGRIVHVRTDTGEPIFEREMTPDERQVRLLGRDVEAEHSEA